MYKVRVFWVLFFLSFLVSYAEERKVAVDLTTGSLERFEYYLLSGLAENINYYKNKLIDIDVVVIIHGDAYKFFIKDLSKSPYKNEKELIKKQYELYQRLKTLHDLYNVKFQICEAGLKSRNIPIENVYSFVKPVHTVFIALVDLQNKGYAYFPIR
ncbi:MAG: DsrE family protein [Aquificae bacterium]|nr:DsrE family protein [Aquificota bacterium]